jgi:hypothetical protein
VESGAQVGGSNGRERDQALAADSCITSLETKTESNWLAILQNLS